MQSLMKGIKMNNQIKSLIIINADNFDKFMEITMYISVIALVALAITINYIFQKCKENKKLKKEINKSKNIFK